MRSIKSALALSLVSAALLALPGHQPAGAAAAPSPAPIYPPQSVFLLPPSLFNGHRLSSGTQVARDLTIDTYGTHLVSGTPQVRPVDVSYMVEVYRTVAEARAHAAPPVRGPMAHPTPALTADEYASTGPCVCPTAGAAYLLGFRYRNIVVGLTYATDGQAPRTTAAHQALPFNSRIAAALLARAQRYAHTHPHDRWPGAR